MAFHTVNEHASGANNYSATLAHGQNVSGITAGLQALPQVTKAQPGGYSLCIRCEEPMQAPAQVLTPPEGPAGILALVQSGELCRRCVSNFEGKPTLSLSRAGLAALETTDPITAPFLARYHLPRILDGHASMPIRDIMGKLVLTVPGFSGVEPNRARRLTVAALEHRDGGGVNGEVRFEKVGWGRWRIGRPGHPAQVQPLPISSTGTHGAQSYTGPTPPTSLESNGKVSRLHPCPRPSGFATTGSYSMSFQDAFAGQSDYDSASDSDTDMDDDVDAMSLDSGDGDQTDEEDWSNLGPEVHRMLRRDRERPSENRNYNLLSLRQGGRHRSPLSQGQAQVQGVAQSAPMGRTMPVAVPVGQWQGQCGLVNGGKRCASEEENAAELLLSLRSQ